MKTSLFVKASLLCVTLALAGCASKVTSPEKYSGFLKDYSGLQETTSASGKTVMRWVAPGFDFNQYDSLVYNPVVYYPIPKPNTQIGEKVLSGILNYTNQQLKTAAAARKPCYYAGAAQPDISGCHYRRRFQQRRAAVL